MKNTKNALLMSVAAAAMIAGVGVACAQAPSPSPAPAAQQNAPAEKTAPVQKPKDAASNKTPDAGAKSSQAVEKMDRKGGSVQGAQDNTKGDMKSKSTSSE